MVSADLWVLLHQVTGPINLGFICRAMANTGFDQLAFSGQLSGEEQEALKFAVHAKDVLKQAKRRKDFDDLTAPIDKLYGFSPRQPWQDGRNLDLDGFLERIDDDFARHKRVGLLFGNEAAGLNNRHLSRCDFRVALPAAQAYVSMNLAQAVMVVLWEIHRRQTRRAQAGRPARQPVLASPQSKQQLLRKVRAFLDAIGFLDPQNPELLWQEIVPIFKTRDWSEREMGILLAVFGKGRVRYNLLARALREAEQATPNTTQTLD